jgi:hypothetical protein
MTHIHCRRHLDGAVIRRWAVRIGRRHASAFSEVAMRFSRTLMLSAFVVLIGSSATLAQQTPATKPDAAQSAPAGKKAVSKACSVQATAKGLHGKARKTFRSACKRNGGKAAWPAKMPRTNTIHNPEFIALARAVFDEVCAALPSERDTQSTRARVAECILKAAGAGERDPARLRAHALRSIDELSVHGEWERVGYMFRRGQFGRLAPLGWFLVCDGVCLAANW